jgi:hypothetical protein
MKLINIAVLSAALLVAFETSAHAYLDPGTGSIILQAVVASVASSLCDQDVLAQAQGHAGHEPRFRPR